VDWGCCGGEWWWGSCSDGVGWAGFCCGGGSLSNGCGGRYAIFSPSATGKVKGGVKEELVISFFEEDFSIGEIVCATTV